MFNSVVLLGNLTKDPELKYTSTGTAVAKIGMATNRKYGDKEETFFAEIVAWGKLAENANQYLSKGSQMLCRGRLKTETWESDGQKRSKVVITAEEIKFVGKKKNGGEEQPAEETAGELEPF
jgi:single-strand DNA-binding protein